jgi:hypothetical protein
VRSKKEEGRKREGGEERNEAGPGEEKEGQGT